MKLALYVGLPLVVVAIAGRLLLGPRRFAGCATRLGLTAVVSAVLLLGAEGAVRWVHRDVTTTANTASWFAQRWMRTVEHNALGFREREVAPRPAPGTYRIAVLGDSFTYGQGIPTASRFTEGLERELSRPTAARRFEVLNFGRSGTETEDHLVLLRDVVLPLQPDFVLLQWFVNDVEGPGSAARPRPLGLLPADALAARFRSHSALFYLAESRWSELQAALGWVQDYEAYMIERFGDADGVDARRADRALREFIATCRERGVPLGIVVFPRLLERTRLGFLCDRVLEVCADTGTRCVDLRPVFDAESDMASLWVNPLDAHPGPRAHELAARAILREFSVTWGVDAPRSGP